MSSKEGGKLWQLSNYALNCALVAVVLQLKSLIQQYFSQDLSQDDYLGLGLQKGMLHLVWDLGWFSRTEFTVPRPDLNDGRWHTVEVDRVRQSLELRVDGEVFGSQVLVKT